MQNDAAEVKLSCRLDEIAGDHSTKGGSSETEAKEFARCDQHLLLLGREGGQKVVTRVWSVMDIIAVPPAPYGRG